MKLKQHTYGLTPKREFTVREAVESQCLDNWSYGSAEAAHEKAENTAKVLARLVEVLVDNNRLDGVDLNIILENFYVSE